MRGGLIRSGEVRLARISEGCLSISMGFAKSSDSVTRLW